MHNALADCFEEGLRSAAIVGSDVPDLPREIIGEAFEALEKHGAVIGPSKDGGYYLIGFSRDCLCRSVFDDMTWSTGRVYHETLRRLRQEGVSVHILPMWRDIDTPEDIAALMKEHNPSDFGASKTINFLKAHGLGCPA